MNEREKEKEGKKYGNRVNKKCEATAREERQMGFALQCINHPMALCFRFSNIAIATWHSVFSTSTATDQNLCLAIAIHSLASIDDGHSVLTCEYGWVGVSV